MSLILRNKLFHSTNHCISYFQYGSFKSLYIFLYYLDFNILPPWGKVMSYLWNR